MLNINPEKITALFYDILETNVVLSEWMLKGSNNYYTNLLICWTRKICPLPKEGFHPNSYEYNSIFSFSPFFTTKWLLRSPSPSGLYFQYLSMGGPIEMWSTSSWQACTDKLAFQRGEVGVHNKTFWWQEIFWKLWKILMSWMSSYGRSYISNFRKLENVVSRDHFDSMNHWYDRYTNFMNGKLLMYGKLPMNSDWFLWKPPKVFDHYIHLWRVPACTQLGNNKSSAEIFQR